MSDDRVKWYRKILSEDPTSRIFVELAEVLYEQGHYPEAAEVCRKGLTLHPTSKRGRVLLGLALWQQGDAGGAEQELTIVQRDLEKNAPIYKVLAEIHWQKGQPGRACKLMDIYLNFQPQDEQARVIRYDWEEQIRNPSILAQAKETETTAETAVATAEPEEAEAASTVPGSDLPEKPGEPEAETARGIEPGTVQPMAPDRAETPAAATTTAGKEIDAEPGTTPATRDAISTDPFQEEPEPSAALEEFVDPTRRAAKVPQEPEPQPATGTKRALEETASAPEPAATAMDFEPPTEPAEAATETKDTATILARTLESWQSRIMQRHSSPSEPEPILDEPGRTSLKRLLRADRQGRAISQ